MDSPSGLLGRPHPPSLLKKRSWQPQSRVPGPWERSHPGQGSGPWWLDRHWPSLAGPLGAHRQWHRLAGLLEEGKTLSQSKIHFQLSTRLLPVTSMQSQNRNNTSKCHVTRPAIPPGFLGEGNIPPSSKNRPQHFSAVILSLYPSIQNSGDISQWVCGYVNHVWKSKWASAKETDRLGSLSLNLYTWST